MAGQVELQKRKKLYSTTRGIQNPNLVQVVLLRENPQSIQRRKKENMVLILALAEPSQFRTLVNIFNRVFENDPAEKLCHPEGYTDEMIATSIIEYTEAQKSSSCHHIAIADTETKEIISFARWDMYPNGRPDNE